MGLSVRSWVEAAKLKLKNWQLLILYALMVWILYKMYAYTMMQGDNGSAGVESTKVDNAMEKFNKGKTRADDPELIKVFRYKKWPAKEATGAVCSAVVEAQS